MTEAGLSKNLIFVVVFLGSFFLLVGLISAGFIYSGVEYSQYEYPDFFDKQDIENIKYFENGTVTRSNKLTLDFTDEINFKFNLYWFLIGDSIGFYHVTWEWAIFELEHEMQIEGQDEYLGEEEILANWDSNLNASDFYPISCNHITVKVWVTDTNSSRNDITEAWNDGSLNIGMGFGFDDVATTTSAWDLLGRLLSFQAIETGSSPLNFLIAIPIWASIAYLAYRLILMAIPFVGD